MTKEELLRELSVKFRSGEINAKEIGDAINMAPVTRQASQVSSEVSAAQNAKKRFSVTKLLYALGAIIAVVGIVLFAFQVWPDIGSLERVSITLGLGLLLAIIGSILAKSRPEDAVGTVFHFIGGLLIPGGAVVALHEFNPGSDLSWPLAISFGAIFILYLFLNYLTKNPILTFFSIANGTAFVYLTVYAITGGLLDNFVDLYAYLTMVIGACYVLLAYSFRGGSNGKLASVLYFFGFAGIQIAALAQYMNGLGREQTLWSATLSLGLIFSFYLFLNFSLKHAGLTFLTILNGTGFVYVLVQALMGGSYYDNPDIYAYVTMVIGAAYILLAHSFRSGPNSRLVEILNFFGITGLLGAAFSQIYGSLPWQLFFLILVLGGFAFSVYSRSRITLVVSTLFLLAYVSYITSEYFADSIGWPISLVILGFIFIGLGYVSFNINKKYIKNSSVENKQ